MARDGRLNVRLGVLYPHLAELANRGRASSRSKPVSEFIFDELEKIVIRRCPNYRPTAAGHRRMQRVA
jgi:hypothetical protein